MHTLAVFLVVLVLALVCLAVLPDVLTSPVLDALDELAFIDGPVGECVLATTLLLAVAPLALLSIVHVCVRVCVCVCTCVCVRLCFSVQCAA